ncbi:class I SAM-dependent methyltransferase [Azoarcus sp. KH32C]|uniref:class I SAM-dependent methyltransferase n=1 Tax=Azoarcus sp. KH32C TaxID=748247 RepID=UPI0002386926|nr:class I SAM-dependent methyltransferase [Azoarcus sp. KH32C]BAL23758.1 methyltransferase [Azoarcus sp. KH32C]
MSDSCRICAHALFPNPLLVQDDMPAAAQGLPGADGLAADRGVSLVLRQCAGCGLVQLTNAPVPYWRDVIRAAGISPEMRSFRLAQFGTWLDTYRLAGRKVLEVGCGRGEYLALLAEAGADAFGIENKSDSVAACRAAGLRVAEGFLEGPETRLADGPFDGFAILNFLEHIPDAPRTLQGIAANLSDGATGLVEVPNFDMIVQQRLFAEFIPDHLYYFTRETLTGLLENNGFEVLDCRPEWHDYVLSATVRKRRPLDLAPLASSQTALKASFDAFLDRFGPGRVAIWGAGHQALALISLMGIAPRIRCVFDSAPFKQGRFTPATHLPIVAPERLADDGPDSVDAIIVLAASYSDEVVRILRERHGSRFCVATLRDNRLEIVIDGDAR